VQVAVGTFNLNDLFSRFDFRADVSIASASSVKVEERTSFSFDDPRGFKLRTRGRRPSSEAACPRAQGRSDQRRVERATLKGAKPQSCLQSNSNRAV
jgi:hypothetical protein